MDIVYTIPGELDTGLVMDQLTDCERGAVAWHLCTSRLPRNRPGRVHFVHDGAVIGSLAVIDIVPWNGRQLMRADGKPVHTRGRDYAIRCGGDFRPPATPRAMRGFQGWRYFHA